MDCGIEELKLTIEASLMKGVFVEVVALVNKGTSLDEDIPGRRRCGGIVDALIFNEAAIRGNLFERSAK